MKPDLIQTTEIADAPEAPSDAPGQPRAALELCPSRRDWLERLFVHAADAILVHRLDGRLIEANPAASQLLGYTCEELFRMSPWDFVTNGSREEMVGLWHRLERGSSVTVEGIFRHKGGQVVPAEIRLHRCESAGDDFIIVTCRDNTGRQRLEDKLRESERRLAEHQRLTHTGSWAWDAATDLTVWSLETFRIFGWDEFAPSPRFQELLATRVHPADRDLVQRGIRASAQKSKPLHLQFRIVLPDGSTKHIESTGRPVTDDGGTVVRLVGTVKDITKRKRAEDASRASEQLARGQVEALTRALDALATESDPDTFLEHVLSIMARQLGAHGVSLWLRDDAGEAPVFHLSFENGRILTAAEWAEPQHGSPSTWEDQPFQQEVINTKRPVLCTEVRCDPGAAPQPDPAGPHGLRTVLGVPLLMAGRVIGWISIRTTRRRRYRAEAIDLAQALAHQATLAIQLSRLAEHSRQAAVLEERNRLAREIHDTLAQGFTGIIVQLEAAQDAILRTAPEQAAQHLCRAGELARRSLGEARRSVRALRPQALEEGSLPAALHRLLQQMTPGTGLQAEMNLEGEQQRLPSEWEETLLRISQEALTNTLKHAHANRFQVRLQFKTRDVTLELRDDGRGFDPTDRTDGFGLTGMKERVERLGGQFSLNSAAGQGTAIRVVLPGHGPIHPPTP